MTVNSAEPRLVVQNTTGTGPFAIPFTFSSGEVKVYKNGVLLSSEFTINVSAQTISMSSPLIVNDKLVVVHDPDVKQDVTFPKLGLMSPLSLETCMDYLTKLVKVINSRAERIIRRSASSADGVLLLRPLQADRLIVPQSDGSLGFGNNAILEIDAMLQQIEAIPGGILSLSENPDIQAVAEFVASVVALATIASTVTSVAANTVNINAVFALKDLIELTVANAQRITDLAAGTPIDGALTNFLWWGSMPYLHDRGNSYITVAGSAGDGDDDEFAIAHGVCLKYFDAPVAAEIVNEPGGRVPFSVRLKRKSAYTGEYYIAGFLQADVMTKLKGAQMTVGVRVRTGSQFDGNITLFSRNAPSLSTVGTPCIPAFIGSADASGTYANQTFAPQVYAFGANEDRYIIFNFTMPSSNMRASVFAFSVRNNTVDWQNPDLTEKDEWVNFSDIFLVKGSWNSVPQFERADVLQEVAIRRLRTPDPFTSGIGGAGARQSQSIVSNSSQVGNVDDLGKLTLIPPNHKYSSQQPNTLHKTANGQFTRFSPVTGARTNQFMSVRMDTGLDYQDDPTGGVNLHDYNYITPPRASAGVCKSLAAGIRVKYHIDNFGRF